MTECKLCGKKYDFLRPHLKVHKISMGDYQKQFPDQLIPKFFDVMFVANRDYLITGKQRKIQPHELCNNTQLGRNK